MEFITTGFTSDAAVYHFYVFRHVLLAFASGILKKSLITIELYPEVIEMNNNNSALPHSPFSVEIILTFDDLYKIWNAKM